MTDRTPTEAPRRGSSPVLSAVLLVLAGLAFLVGEYIVLIMIGYTAEGPDGTTPDQRPLTVIAIVWGLLTLGTAVAALVASVRRIRQGRGVVGPVALGAVLWAVLSAAAIGVMSLFG
ncbi:hypothetical protein [Brachybacterium huguangmaarense]